MPDFAVPWAGQELPISLPEDWTLHQFASSQLGPSGEDEAERLAAALNQPNTSQSLGALLGAEPNGRVILVVEDITRHSPLVEILAVVMREIRHARVSEDRIEIIFANGMHPPMTPEQAREKLGPEAAKLKWRNNPWHDRDQYIHIGSAGKVEYLVDRQVATADLRIIISMVCPHLQAGFGGGYKMIFPGCSHLDTIRAIHRLGIGRRPKQLVGTEVEKNPMRQVIDAGGKLLEQYGGQTFAVQYLLDDNDRPAHIAAGDPISTQRMLAKRCSVACGIVTQGPRADVLVTNAYPRDFDLWQALKTIANTRLAVRPGGVVICLARCEAGLHGMNPPRWPLNPPWTRRAVRWLGPEAICSLLTRLVPRLAGDAAFFVRMGLQALYRNPIFIVSPALHALDANFPGIKLFADIDQAFAAAVKLLGGRPQRVVVFPSGGTTFPVPTPGPDGKPVE
ncbi:MAG: lactate racemase domain-containing protein [Phycisphaerae bacterium]|jgi:nickel-dependent lactate racemase|nr:lactate racemase domain-containing protein [Phycisphaerae bacterium]